MRTMRAVGLVMILSGYVMLCSGCISHMDPSLLDECDNKWIPTYFKRSTEIERTNRFKTYGIDDQYSILICGNQRWHPPDLTTVELFALNGKKGADYLKIKLTQATDDITINCIINVFEEMCRQNTYNVNGDKDLMRLISDKVSGMKDKFWRELTEQWVKEIREMK